MLVDVDVAAPKFCAPLAATVTHVGANHIETLYAVFEFSL